METVSCPARIKANTFPADIESNSTSVVESFPPDIDADSPLGFKAVSFPTGIDADSILDFKVDSFPPGIDANSTLGINPNPSPGFEANLFPHGIDANSTLTLEADSFPPGIHADSILSFDANSFPPSIEANSTLDHSSTSAPTEFAYLPSSVKKTVLKSILSANVSYPLLYKIASLHYGVCHLLSSSFSNSDLVNLLNIHTCSTACLISVQHVCAAGLTDVISLSANAVKVFCNLNKLGPPSVHCNSVKATSFPPSIDGDGTPGFDANPTNGIEANSSLEYFSTSTPTDFAYLPSSSKKIVLKYTLSANFSYPLLYQIASLHYGVCHLLSSSFQNVTW